ncbi:MAG: guanylate kinase [Clostridiales bacterium]|nr:guanylate kinase [Clostridiales bacterium]
MKPYGEGLLLVVSGPAGVGKGTINAALMQRNPEVKMSVSATTRAPRPGELAGVHYFFKSEAEFRRMIEEGAFLEWMHVFKLHYYGTPKSFVEEQLAQGNSVVLEIDVEGAMKVRESYPGAVLVFIAPPTMADLKTRLIGRGTETAEVIEKRFQIAVREMEYMEKYDYVVINRIPEQAVAHMEAIITAEKCRPARMPKTKTEQMGGKKL